MEKLQIRICERVYSLLTDEEPERIERIARALEERIKEFGERLKGRPETEILTLTAFDLLDNADKDRVSYEKTSEEMNEKIKRSELENRKLLIENMNSAESELAQIAVVKEQENNELRAKLLEYEKLWDEHSMSVYDSAGDALSEIASIKERENSELRVKLSEYEKLFDSRVNDTYKSAALELEAVAAVNNEENAKLRDTLHNYEKSFDSYAKSKEAEIIRLQKELEETRGENDELKQRFAALTDDGQLTIC
ncbi:MAG: cell division protein ZapA [Oscillospiraceae bacterium]|jgi:cell division protein ZapA (FtsZ GTPase activity inhibitor)|nr:cell division protein ZapA [Oscillospiraceae bacterium]